nr:hypothetical protein [Tanacetum cinerariifolium]
STNMSFENSVEVSIPDREPAGHVADATVLPKFDMHLFTSTLNEGNIEWVKKAYSIPKDLHHRVAPKGMTMTELPSDAIGLYLHHFKQCGLRVPFSTFFLGVIHLPALGNLMKPMLRARLKDVPPKTRLMEFAEKPCPKVLTEKEKKRLKAAEKAAAKAAQGGDAPTKDKKVMRFDHNET